MTDKTKIDSYNFQFSFNLKRFKNKIWNKTTYNIDNTGLCTLTNQ